MFKIIDRILFKNSKRSLKNLWLNPGFQGRYIFWISITGLLLVVINASIFYFFTRENYALLVDLGPMTAEAKAQLYRELWQIIGYLIIGSFGFLSVVAIVGLIFSHRAAGPIFHFTKVFTEVKNGNTALRIRLRPNDEFKEAAQAFNEMMDSLESKILK